MHSLQLNILRRFGIGTAIQRRRAPRSLVRIASHRGNIVKDKCTVMECIRFAIDGCCAGRNLLVST